MGELVPGTRPPARAFYPAIKETPRLSLFAQHLVRFIHDIRKWLILWYHEVDACLHYRLFAHGVCVEREKKNRNLREHTPQYGRRFQSIHNRHRQVQDDQVGIALLRGLDALLSVSSLHTSGK